MKKLILVIILTVPVLYLSGCAPPPYLVQVNGYTDTGVPAGLSPGAAIFVIENKEAANQLLEKEIKGKIIKLLEKQGYRISPFEKADYYLLFAYGIGPGRNVTVVMPDYYPFGMVFYPGYPFNRSYLFVAPPVSYVSYSETLYDRWLLLNVIEGKHYRDKGAFRTLWVGEAKSTGASSDLRVAVNYLLAAAFEQFGKNTGKAVDVEIPEQDTRVKELAQ